MIPRRAPVEVLLGRSAEAERGIENDFALLEAARAGVTVWTCDGNTVVLGASRDPAVEVDEDECRRRRVAVLRRASGGGTVVIGRGTVQYAFVVPHPAGTEPPSLDAVKSACNAAVVSALAGGGVHAPLATDASGDLRVDDRKVGGLALRRHRHATLLHGTLLVDADLEQIAALLKHPVLEPKWRQGRSHLAFLANLGRLDVAAFANALKPIQAAQS